MRTMLVALFFGLAAGSALASPPLRAPVEIPATGFKAVLDDGRVIASWRRYRRDDFASYQVVKSASNQSPVCPTDPVIFNSDVQTDLRYEDGRLSQGTWRYRLCIVTRFGDRWVSPVVTLAIEAKDLRRAPPTEADFE